MISVMVTYTVNPEFITTNKTTIQKFLNDFKNLGQSPLGYNVFIKEDGITFVHFKLY